MEAKTKYRQYVPSSNTAKYVVLPSPKQTFEKGHTSAKCHFGVTRAASEPVGSDVNQTHARVKQRTKISCFNDALVLLL